MDWLLDLFGLNQGKATQDAAAQNKQILSDLKTEGMGYINAGNDTAEGYLNDILDLTSLGEAGKGMYANALGLGGEEGTLAALAAFQEGPGYQFAMDQGLDAIERNASARGRLNSGNTDIDLLKYATGYADQAWDDWLGNLNTGINREASSLGDLATLAQQTAGTKLDFASDISSGFMGANNQNAAGIEKNKEGWAGFGKGLMNLGGKALGYGGGF